MSYNIVTKLTVVVRLLGSVPNNVGMCWMLYEAEHHLCVVLLTVADILNMAKCTGSKIRWKRPILSTTQASCWGTNSITVFMGRLEAHRCWTGLTRHLGTARWVCYRGDS